MISRAVIESAFTVVPDRCTGEEVTILCPLEGCPDRSGNRGINVRTGMSSCFRCNKGFRSLRALAAAANVEIDDDGMGSLDSTVGGIDDAMRELSKPRRAAPGYVAEVKLPRGFEPLELLPQSAYERRVAKMAERKNLEYADLVAAGVGTTRIGAWEPFAIFPVKEWRRNVYYQGRTYTDKPGESTKKFPSRLELELGARYWVYGIDELRERGGVAVVVESILNVLSLRKELARRDITEFVPVCVFKSKVSDVQAKKILACRGLTEVAMLFDPDAANKAWHGARRMANRVELSLVEMPSGVDANDDAVTAVDNLLRRKRYSPLSEIEEELRSL